MSRITLLDGGTGRELMRLGAPFRQPEWSALALMEGPDFVTRVHEGYVTAGADVITTNSYAVVPFHLGADRFAHDGSRLAALAGTLAAAVARRAARKVAVAGSLPPVCGSYRPDLFDPAVARPVLGTLIAALAPSIDHWLGETLSSIAEAELLREAIGEDSRPLWLSFTLADAPGSSGGLRSGESVEQAVQAALRLGAAAVLFNCSQPEVMQPAVVKARALIGSQAGSGGQQIPVGVYANAFEPQNAAAQANSQISKVRDDQTAAAYLRWAESWVAAGARIVGGCCGIGPEHIAALHARFHDSVKNSD